MRKSLTPTQSIHAIAGTLSRNGLALADANYLGSGEYELTARDPGNAAQASVQVSPGFETKQTARILIDAVRKPPACT